MKTVFLTTAFLFSLLQGFGQVDSMNLKTGPFLLEARDAEYIGSLFVFNQPLQEFLYFDIRDKYRSAGAPTGTTVLRMDSVKVSTLVYLSQALRNSAYQGSKNVYSRINAAIRACNNSFLSRHLDLLDKKEEYEYNTALQEGRRKLMQ